jgi:uncharacterized membrane protein
MSEITESGFSENTVAAIAYITFVPAICFLILPRYNGKAYVRFHAWQSLLLNLVMFVLVVILTFLAAPAMIIGAAATLWIQGLLWLAWTLVWVICAVSALNGRVFKLPLLGALAQKEAKLIV